MGEHARKLRQLSAIIPGYEWTALQDDAVPDWLRYELKNLTESPPPNMWEPPTYAVFPWRNRPHMGKLLALSPKRATLTWIKLRWQDALFSEKRTRHDKQRTPTPPTGVRLAFGALLEAAEFRLAYQIVDDWYAMRNAM